MRVQIITFLIIALPSTVAFCDTERPTVRLGPNVPKDFNVGQDMMCKGIDLRGSEFVGQNLDRAFLEGCDLSGVRFHQCTLKDAIFRKSSLRGATFTECVLANANFDNAIINEMNSNGRPELSIEQFLTTSSYKNKDLRDCVIPGLPVDSVDSYDFSGANLSRSVAYFGDFTECNFEGATITGMQFQGGVISFRQLASTLNYERRSFANIAFGCRILGKIDFSNLDLRRSHMAFDSEAPALFNNSDISECYFHKVVTFSQLQSSESFQNGELIGITFMHFDLSNSDLSGINLSHSKFLFSNMSGAKLDDAVISHCWFEETQGLNIEQIKSTWNFKHSHMEIIKLPKDMLID